MAPTRPSKSCATLTNHSSLASSVQRPQSLDHPYAVPHQQNKAPAKAHKRFIKHANFLSRLQRTAPGSKVTKRRRPSKKLVTSLEDLEDALPTASNERQGGSEARTQPDQKMKQKPLKSRPGAMKRKEKCMTAERERFAKNLALMAAGPNDDTKNEEGPKVADVKSSKDIADTQYLRDNKAKWAAIRDHIGRTMETVDHKKGSSPKTLPRITPVTI